MNLNKTTSGLLLLILCVGGVYAQEAVPSTGGNGSGTNGTISYSVGQVVYTESTGSTGSINQGVQQPYDISTNGIDEELENIGLSVYPNPTEDVLVLSIEETDISGYSYALFNQKGQLIESNHFASNHIEIFMQELNAASYILKVMSDEEVVKTYTIIKH